MEKEIYFELIKQNCVYIDKLLESQSLVTDCEAALKSAKTLYDNRFGQPECDCDDSDYCRIHDYLGEQHSINEALAKIAAWRESNG